MKRFVQIPEERTAAFPIARKGCILPDQIEKTPRGKLPGVHEVHIELIEIFVGRSCPLRR